MEPKLGLDAVQQKRPKVKRPRARDDRSTGTGAARALVYRDGRARKKQGTTALLELRPARAQLGEAKKRDLGTSEGDAAQARAVARS